MTAGPNSRDNRCKFILIAVAVGMIMVALPLAAGCVWQSHNGNNVTTISIPSLHTTINTQSRHDIQAKPTPALMYSTGSETKSPAFYELILPWDDRFYDFLHDWNKKMSWGFSQQEIDGKYARLKHGVLNKYQFPDNSTLYIENISEFCSDLGNAMGLSPAQSEQFATTADTYYTQQRMGPQEKILHDALKNSSYSSTVNK